MRILHVTDCYLPRLGGIELQVDDLASRQADAGHDVTVLTTTAGVALSIPRLGDDPGGDGLPPGQAGGAGGSRIRVVSVARDRHPREKIMYRSTRRGVRRLLDQLDDFDLVHVHASSFSPLVFLSAHHASRRGVPTVATVHSLWAKATPLFRGADLLAGWGGWPVVWSAVSNAAAAPLRSILGGRVPVAILPNGVDPDDWRVAHDGAGPAATGEPRVLRVAVVSRLARRKRVVPLVEILRAAHDRLPTGVILDVRVLGEGPKRGELERYLKRHDMDSWVHLVGRRSRGEIREVFSHSDLFVAPASLESFGIAALEARCAGLPVLARSGTGVQDFVAHGVEGWLVDSDRAMIEAIVALAVGSERLDLVADHNRTVPARISWKVVLDECEELYEQAAVGHGRRWQRAGSQPERIPEGHLQGVDAGARSGGSEHAPRR